MGQFNHEPCPGCVDVWRATWEKYVPVATVTAVCPSPKGDAFGKQATCDTYYTQEQNPGWTMPYKNLARALLNVPENTTGLLYVHDDMVVTPAFLRRLQSHTWVRSDTLGSTSPGNYRRVSWDRRMPATPESRRRGGGRLWPWRKPCEAAARALPAEKKGYWNSTHPLQLVTHQSDMLYIDTTRPHIVREFVELLKVMARTAMFLECALPTALEAIRRRWDLQVETAAVCTSWAKHTRHRYRAWACTQKKETRKYELFHPVKLSLYKTWDAEWAYIHSRV